MATSDDRVNAGRWLGASLAIGRVLFGVSYLVRPGLAGPTWIGTAARRPEVRALVRAQAARDVALGAGAARAVVRDSDPSAWLVAFAAADAVDAAATWRARKSLSPRIVAMVLMTALGSAALSALAAALVGKRARIVQSVTPDLGLNLPLPLLASCESIGCERFTCDHSSMTTPQNDLDVREGPRDECGVFGIYAPEQEVSRLAYFSLFALQHRGQESAGIAAADTGGYIITQRALGLVSQVFQEHDLRALSGDLAIGHVRYSTTGSNEWENSQPVHRSAGSGGNRRELALAHNGNLINAVELHAELSAEGVTFSSTSDSEIIAALLASHPAEDMEDVVAEVMPRLKGAYSTVVMTKDRVVAFRDPAGIRPLVLGQLGDRYCVASESCAFDIIGAKYLRDVAPGEVITLYEKGMKTRQAVESERQAFCVFEYIYFARPDSRMNGDVLQASRGRMGEILARDSPVEGADLVIAVPDSGNAAARGFARGSGLPQDDGFVKNRYVQRTFIQPGQALRKHGLRMKFNALEEIVGGKSLVVVDDSIVRGNTTRQIVQMLREAGAKEVHMRISAPPIKHPCHYGIDMSTREEMVAHERTPEEVAEHLRCDSLAYISLDGVYEAVNGERANHCDACFTGEYPLDGGAQAKNAFENALPLVRA